MNGLNFSQSPRPFSAAGYDRVDTGEFWPVIDLNDLRAAARVDQTVPDERLLHVVINAAVYVNEQLAFLQQKAQARGIGRLADYDPRRVNGESLSEIRYRRAVYSYAKALLLETYADYDATGKTASRADAKQDIADEARREGHFAVADMLGRSRVDSELV